jgi:hypothetical protein
VYRGVVLLNKNSSREAYAPLGGGRVVPPNNPFHSQRHYFRCIADLVQAESLDREQH